MRKDKKLKIRTATMDDLEMIAAVEAECFPAAEAATREEFAKRLQHYNVVLKTTCDRNLSHTV